MSDNSASNQNGSVIKDNGQPSITRETPEENDDAGLLEQTRGLIKTVGGALGWLGRLGLPKTSWRNKCPYARPRPDFLARGLKNPPAKFEFDNEDERLAFMRKARAPRKFMFGTPPTYSFMVANLAFLGLILWHDQGAI